MRTVVEDDKYRPVIKEVFKWEPPKEKTIQQGLDKYRIGKGDS